MPCELKVRVTPRSSRTKVKVEDGQVKVWVMASPTDGQANEAVCRAVADALDLPNSGVSIRRGHASREKSLEIRDLDLDEAMARLSQ